jgi:hypothetical protein
VTDALLRPTEDPGGRAVQYRWPRPGRAGPG